ncbi:MAG: response regulator [Planctomycetaceae bacterium]
MLILSRRSKEKISFPQLGITIHFIRIQSGTAKVGVDAPLQVEIIRDEIRPEKSVQTRSVRDELLELPKNVRHNIRNELHVISVGAHLLKEQLEMGMKEEALDTFQTIQESLKRLDDNKVLKKPEVRSSKQDEKTGPPTVLVVEDEANERELLASLLAMNGFSVRSVANGAEALEFLADHETPSVILMDMKMPTSDGATTIRKIRTDDHLKNVRVFAVSGTSPEENGLNRGTDGVNEWFPKPVNVPSLLKAMELQAVLN